MAASLIVVFSGFRDDSLKTQIESKLNGRVMSALSNQVTHLVVKENGKTSKKVDEAKEAGVTVVFLKDFIAEHGLTLTDKPKVKKTKKENEEVVESTEPSADEAEPKMVHSESDVNKALLEVIQEETHIQPKKKPVVKKSKKTDDMEPIELEPKKTDDVPKKKTVVKKSKKTDDIESIELESKKTDDIEPIELESKKTEDVPKKKTTLKKSKKETEKPEITALKLEIEAAKKHLAELETKLVEISV
jgi:hypothetical protein